MKSGRNCPDDLLQIFRARLRYDFDPSGCYVWRGAKSPKGYGIIGTNKDGTWKVPRIAYQIVKGAIGDGLEIDHLCFNPPCINPDHLEAVTPTINTRRGLKSKLTFEKAEEIRDLYATGAVSMRQLARAFEVPSPSIVQIVHYRQWRALA